ncbi:DUF1801 domain-containing protein [Anaerocolumna sp. AGMB13025]|uniref:iron chaperone n=1 Tax=Anaerocolumna sp. AGMB13025 TaxID=3039116 RepID=UPI00241E629C|nr:DUF1801 domain-containing protein [Anaerocolumna sp. AGMB13025]WFR59262.1 DUF1801 domain-containing protein [Anaerocolumna sp. AGMB13025]
MDKIKFDTIDEYIMNFTPDIQEKLQQLRKVIQEAAPEAVEKISWGMPTFFLKGNLIHFAAFKNHIGIYPGETGVETFKAELTEYKNSKGAIQFSNDRPIPFDLVTRIVTFRVNENLEHAKDKQSKKK